MLAHSMSLRKLSVTTSKNLKSILGLCSVVTRKRTENFKRLAIHDRLLEFHNSRLLFTGVKSTMDKAIGNRLSWKLTAEGIKESADDLIATHKKIWDSVGSVKLDDVSYDSIIKVGRLLVIIVLVCCGRLPIRTVHYFVSDDCSVSRKVNCDLLHFLWNIDPD